MSTICTGVSVDGTPLGLRGEGQMTCIHGMVLKGAMASMLHHLRGLDDVRVKETHRK